MSYRVRVTSPVDRNYVHLSPVLASLEAAQKVARDLQLNSPLWTIRVSVEKA